MIRKKMFLLFVGIVLAMPGLLIQTAISAETVKEGKVEGKKSTMPLQTCASCHADFKTVLPADHPSVAGSSLKNCLQCHKYSNDVIKKTNPFSARLHRAHANANTALDCVICHTWKPGKRFFLPGNKKSLGVLSADDMKLEKTVFASWSHGQYLDAVHGNVSVICSNCHGAAIPQPDATVENKVCLACHGASEDLAKKTEPKDFPDRNPHKSHLGEINCIVCHKAHVSSTIICLDCHKKFNMKIKGEAPEQSR
jgi:hypothetical protein